MIELPSEEEIQEQARELLALASKSATRATREIRFRKIYTWYNAAWMAWCVATFCYRPNWYDVFAFAGFAVTLVLLRLLSKATERRNWKAREELIEVHGRLLSAYARPKRARAQFEHDMNKLLGDDWKNL